MHLNTGIKHIFNIVSSGRAPTLDQTQFFEKFVEDYSTKGEKREVAPATTSEKDASASNLMEHVTSTTTDVGTSDKAKDKGKGIMDDKDYYVDNQKDVDAFKHIDDDDDLPPRVTTFDFQEYGINFNQFGEASSDEFDLDYLFEKDPSKDDEMDAKIRQAVLGLSAYQLC